MTDEITLDAPETRIERFLAAAAGVEGITLDEPVTRIEKYLYKIAQGGGSGGLPPVTESDNGKVLTGDNWEWTPMGELQPENNITIEANVEQDGSFSTVETINYVGERYLYNRGCLFVKIYRNDSLEQVVKCDFATDIADGLSWVFRGNYFDTLSDEPKTIAVSFQPPHSPDADPASITITNIYENNMYFVRLTPNSPDFSGTADKTLNEVNSAYEAGMEIVARILFNGAVIEAKLVQVIHGAEYFPTFYWMAIYPQQNMQILAYNATNADDPNPTPFNYSTYIYTLTPAT